MSKISTYYILFILMIGTCTSNIKLIAQSSPEIYFRDGVVLNQKTSEIYFSNKASIVEAVDIKSGITKWSTKIKGKPILLHNNELYVQIIGNGIDSKLNFAVLDIANNGRQINAITTQISNNNFSASGRLSTMPYKVGNNHYIVWTYHPPLRGVYQEDDDYSLEKGALLLDGRSFKVLDMKDLPKGYNNNPITVSKNQKINREKGQQFWSRDKKHILVSTFKSKPEVLNNYVWKIYDRKAKKIIGKLENHVSYAPFIVNESNLIFVRNAYELFKKDKITAFPLQLIWYDLNNNKVIKAIDILDTTYKGPTPP